MEEISVLLPTPAYSRLTGPLSYSHPSALPPGSLVRVPLGARDSLGLVWPRAEAGAANPAPPERVLKPIAQVLDVIPPLLAHWLQLVDFAAHYYQRSVGEFALACLPPQLREVSAEQLARKLKKHNKINDLDISQTKTPPVLTTEQATALARLDSDPGPFVLHGNTGSGKTEVYLRRAALVLAQDPLAQVLMLVPEINLTPQLEERVRQRFANLGEAAIVSMHSGMTPAQRLNSWLSAHTGQARLVLGTRMAVLASMPHLRLIVVDEEHDPSYKQQEGARYSARDLAVYRGQLDQAQVILGSATPSLESWHHSRPAVPGEPAPRYQRLAMPSRVGSGALPLLRRVDMNKQPRKTLVSAPLLAAMRERLARQEQVLLLLNRRGYAPVLHCASCGWKSECPHCSAYRVFHKADRTLRCHHCSLTQPVPRACPGCGNQDIGSFGHGTERLEEHLAELLADMKRPDGSALRIARIDADSIRLKGELVRQLAEVHDGDVDVLVGTQMVAKGHDFRRVTLVAALNPDGALFSADFRAPERLFSLLMQAAGRAGRDAELSDASPCEMWVQTFHPAHPLFETLKQHDFAAFAEQQLRERSQAGLPPFTFQALVRAEARSQEAAQDFLNAARQAGDTWLAELELAVTLYPAVPMSMQRVANVERAQMLIESGSRRALQHFLAAWQADLQHLRASHKAVLRWAIDVDPLAI
ncbi:PriA Primosomal protein N' (replication factor Y) - superfamily II helicase [Burkholderiaceae bacterium]